MFLRLLARSGHDCGVWEVVPYRLTQVPAGVSGTERVMELGPWSTQTLHRVGIRAVSTLGAAGSSWRKEQLARVGGSQGAPGVSRTREQRFTPGCLRTALGSGGNRTWAALANSCQVSTCATGRLGMRIPGSSCLSAAATARRWMEGRPGWTGPGTSWSSGRCLCP